MSKDFAVDCLELVARMFREMSDAEYEKLWNEAYADIEEMEKVEVYSKGTAAALARGRELERRVKATDAVVPCEHGSDTSRHTMAPEWCPYCEGWRDALDVYRARLLAGLPPAPEGGEEG